MSPVVTARWFVFGLLALLAILFLGGCASRPSYRGYKHSPYTIRGIRYHPMSPHQARGFTETGTASHYKGGSIFRHGTTAIGEKLGPNTRAAAHKTLPLPSTIRVTNLRNGRSTVVRVNDRGPFIQGRILDVTVPVAKELGFYKQGLTPVRIEVLSIGDGRYRIRG
jgi:rare lipoprotein A